MYGHVMSPKKFSYLFVYVYGFKRKNVRVTRFLFGKGMVEKIKIYTPNRNSQSLALSKW